MKTCPKCKENKSEAKFWKDKTTKDGLRYWCKKCNRKAQKNWEDKNPEKANQIRSEWQKKARTTNPRHKLLFTLRSIICQTLNRRRIRISRASLENRLGYPVEKLIGWLEMRMEKDGFTWNDYLSGKCELDHVFPISSWNFDSPDDVGFKGCFHYMNLRMVSKEYNMHKKTNLDELGKQMIEDAMALKDKPIIGVAKAGNAFRVTSIDGKKMEEK
jgi:hypothetical protein